MKTKSTVGRLITHFSKWLESGARVAAMLLLLCTTALPAWAEYEMEWDKMVTDQGGGEVQYKGYSDNIQNQNYWHNYSEFTTKKTFNPSTISEMILYFYCVIIASDTELEITYDDFLNWLDDNENTLKDFTMWLSKMNEVESTTAKKKSVRTQKKA